MSKKLVALSASPFPFMCSAVLYDTSFPHHGWRGGCLPLLYGGYAAYILQQGA